MKVSPQVQKALDKYRLDLVSNIETSRKLHDEFACKVADTKKCLEYEQTHLDWYLKDMEKHIKNLEDFDNDCKVDEVPEPTKHWFEVAFKPDVGSVTLIEIMTALLGMTPDIWFRPLAVNHTSIDQVSRVLRGLHTLGIIERDKKDVVRYKMTTKSYEILGDTLRRYAPSSLKFD